jgi:pimeloyl-ACP methyl ester carboxylesterase
VPDRAQERLISSGDATICTEAFGDPGNPPVLLVMGQMASMMWWPEEFCRKLAETGRFVIRYDHRDTGKSTSYPPGDPGYTAAEMQGDPIAVLDGYGIESANVVGMSMGGAIAQVVALSHPARVATLTAISTSQVSADDRQELPAPSTKYMEHAGRAESVDWSDTEAIKAFLLSDCRELAGSKHPFDERAARELIAADTARAENPLSVINHELLDSDEDAEWHLDELQPPLLVIHGTSDPLFPRDHGRALADAVPGARLVEIDGGGHELHPNDWDQIIEAIAGHTAGESSPRTG